MVVDVVADEEVAVVDAKSTEAALERTTVEAISMAIPPSLPPPSPLLPALLSGESFADASVTPIADEDLLRWRAFGFRGMTEPTTPDASPRETSSIQAKTRLSEVPAVNELPVANVKSSAIAKPVDAVIPVAMRLTTAEEPLTLLPQNGSSPVLRAVEARTGMPIVDARAVQTFAVESPSVASPAADTVALSTEVPVKKDLGMGRLLSLTMPARGADSLVDRGDTAGNTSLQVAMTP
ncbi:MAG: hypothetical protein FJ179_06175, partial [Gammaproteobacteria bacterium]|nr:hypothetical protein [Gammaproteobacteria bacterium]